MARTLRSDTALAVSIFGLGSLLVFVGNVLLGQWQSAEQHNQSFSFEQLLGFVASAAGTAIVAWWVLSVVIAFLASLLLRVGQRKGADALSKFSPAFMLRLAVAVMSLNLLGTGVVQAATAPPDPRWQSTSASTLERAPAAWTPTSTDQAISAAASANDVDTPWIKVHDPRWQPRPPMIDPGLLSRQSSRQRTSTNETNVVVQDGDSLWSIAAAKLGPFATDVEVALAWPKWYAVNRATIGGDPTVLLPGQVLRPPSPG